MFLVAFDELTDFTEIPAMAGVLLTTSTALIIDTIFPSATINDCFHSFHDRRRYVWKWPTSHDIAE